MGFTTKLMLFGFSLAFMLYLVGYGQTTTGLGLLISGGWYSQVGLELIIDSVISAFAVSLLAAVGTSFFSSSSTLITWSILAAFISSFLINFMLSPMSVLGELGLVSPLNYGLGIVINIMIVAGVITFIRGGD